MRAANAALAAIINGTRKGLRFASANSTGVDCGTPVSLQLVNDLTVEFWYTPTALDANANKNVAVSGRRTETTCPFNVWIGVGNIGMDQNHPVAGWITPSVSVANPIGTPFHCAITRSGATEIFYKNGVQIGAPINLGVSGGFNAGNGTLIGRGFFGGTWFTDCIMDEVRLYSRGLSAAEVLAHYRGIFQYGDDVGLVGWWPFDENTGTTAFDLSGLGNNGTLQNAPAYVDSNPWPGNERQYHIADLLTVGLLNGGTLRYTSSDFDIRSGGNTFSSTGPLFICGKTKLVVGVQVDQMDLSFFPDPSHLVNGQPFMQAVGQGVFDGATVTLERAFMPTWGNTAAGTLVKFSGRVGDIESTRTAAAFKVNSDLELLNIQMPRNVYQPPCLHTVYDGGCALIKANFAVAGTVSAGSTASIVNASAMTTSAGEFELGTIEFLTGVLAGVKRTVKSYAVGIFTLIQPLPGIPQIGDTFNAYPGCDKQQSTCGVNVGITYTANSATDIFTATAHGLLNDQAVKLSTTGTFPGAAPALNATTQYFVVNRAANTFQLARTIGGAPIDLSSNGTGTNKIAQAGKFANLVNYRGMPYVPLPETMI